MPFQSYAQAAYLKHNEPEVYNRWKKEHGKEPVNKIKYKKKKGRPK